MVNQDWTQDSIIDFLFLRQIRFNDMCARTRAQHTCIYVCIA